MKSEFNFTLTGRFDRFGSVFCKKFSILNSITFTAMHLKFSKYQGTGNDFIIIDCMKEPVVLNTKQVRFLCDRRFGIGADGLMMLVPDKETDFLMEYYNADGNISSMCGNGGRCLVNFAAHKKYIGSETNFLAIDGIHKAIIPNGNNLVRLQMGDVKLPQMVGDDIVLDTGSPHYVRFVKSADDVDVIGEGRKVRYNDIYKSKGINVNFVEIRNDCLYMRTYERGVEDETLSCGTGVTASVLAAAFTKRIAESGKQKVKTPGGELFVQYEKVGDEFKNVWLEGEAAFVYSGEIEIL